MAAATAAPVQAARSARAKSRAPAAVATMVMTRRAEGEGDGVLQQLQAHGRAVGGDSRAAQHGDDAGDEEGRDLEQGGARCRHDADAQDGGGLLAPAAGWRRGAAGPAPGATRDGRPARSCRHRRRQRPPARRRRCPAPGTDPSPGSAPATARDGRPRRWRWRRPAPSCCRRRARRWPKGSSARRGPSRRTSRRRRAPPSRPHGR